MRPLVSIVIPSIRVENIPAIYYSITKSTKETFELIVCGPKVLPESIRSVPNIRYISDWGSPVRASCIAAELACGDYLVWSSDDALFLPGALDEMLAFRAGNDMLVGKYYEGMNGQPKAVQPDSYFKLNNSEATRTQWFSDDWWLFNVGMMHRFSYLSMMGWDCSYEGTFFSHADLAVRWYIKGMKVTQTNVFLLDCDHNQNDHKPIEIAQVHHDMPFFLERYKIQNPYIKIKGWGEVPAVWDKRFKVNQNVT